MSHWLDWDGAKVNPTFEKVLSLLHQHTMSVRTAWAGPRSAARLWADRNTCGYVWLRKKAAARAEELKNISFAQEDL
jgi:hypothetical protein